MDVDRSKQSIGKFCSSKDIDKSINKLWNMSNELINKNILLIKTIEPSSEILEILEITENHTSHKDKIKRKYGIKPKMNFC